MSNKVKDKFAAGEVAYGVWADVFSADLLEICGYLGFDYAVLDGEHTDLDPANAGVLIKTCELSGMVPIVRVPEINESLILRYLEIGVKGIYTPHTNTAQEAHAVVSAVRYAPVGHRGAGSMRALRFGIGGSFDQLCEQANADTMVIALIEEMRGIDNLDEILKVDGVDAFGIGPGDLSHTMGYVGHKEHPDVMRLVFASEDRILKAGKIFDSVVGDLDEARDCKARGSQMISFTLRGCVIDGMRTFLKEMQST